MMRIVRLLHKWVGLIAGLQMLLWLASGLIMSLLDHHVVSGASTAMEEAPSALLPPDAAIVDPQPLLAHHAGEAVREVELQLRLDEWVWRVQSDQRHVVYDAQTGVRIEIDEQQARRSAAAGYAGKGALIAATLLEQAPTEARKHAAPLWRVDFDDGQHTRYYLAHDDGRILERRTGDYGVFDFFWMLHTMDYRGRDDFNHPLVITFAFLSVWLSLSGVILLYKRFAPRKPAVQGCIGL